MHTKKLLLDGRVTDVLHRGLQPDQPEFVTFLVEGAEPLWAEIGLPNIQDGKWANVCRSLLFQCCRNAKTWPLAATKRQHLEFVAPLVWLLNSVLDMREVGGPEWHLFGV